MIPKLSIKIILITFVSLFLSCKNDVNTEKKESINDQYTVTGSIEGLENGTKLYLNRDNEIIDSTTITNNSFQFQGAINEPDLVFLYTKNSRDFWTSFWLENHEISIKGNVKGRKNIEIKGGPTQEDANLSKKSNDSLSQILDSIQVTFSDPKITTKETDSLRNLQFKVLDKIRHNAKEFIKQNPNSFLSLSYLNFYKANWSKDSVKTLYNNLSGNLKESSQGSILKTYISLTSKPEIGEQFIDFELPDTTGNTIKVSDLKSKYTLIEFWASWCGPCRQENPNLIKIYNTFNKKGFEIVGISLDKRKKDWIKAIQKDKLLWPQLSDLKEFESYPAMIYSINGIPYNFLIDENGVIVAEDLRGNRLEKKLEELFSKL